MYYQILINNHKLVMIIVNRIELIINLDSIGCIIKNRKGKEDYSNSSNRDILIILE